MAAEPLRGQRPVAVVLGLVVLVELAVARPARTTGSTGAHSVAGALVGRGRQRRRSSASPSSPATCSPSRSPRSCWSSPSSAPWSWPGGPQRVASEMTREEQERRSSGSAPSEGGPMTVPGAWYLVLAALLFSIGAVGAAGPAQRAGHVHVRRAHAQRRQPDLRHLRPDAQRHRRPGRSCSSCWSWPPPRSWSASAIIVAIFRRRAGATADDIHMLKG